jgi:hypothetical protein
MDERRLGSIYVTEYLKILERAATAMERFPLMAMSTEERKAVVLSYVDLVDSFQKQLKDAGIARLLDLYDEGKGNPAMDEDEEAED